MSYFLGTTIWVLKENQVAPELQYQQILLKNKFNLYDVNETLKHESGTIAKQTKKYDQIIIQNLKLTNKLTVRSLKQLQKLHS